MLIRDDKATTLNCITETDPKAAPLLTCLTEWYHGVDALMLYSWYQRKEDEKAGDWYVGIAVLLVKGHGLPELQVARMFGFAKRGINISIDVKHDLRELALWVLEKK